MAGGRRPSLLVVLAVVFSAACGDGGPNATAGTTAAVTTTGPSSSTVTAATTSTTTLPDDGHPAWPVSWAALWPADGSTARVQAVEENGGLDAVVGIDYGVPWGDGAWDRIWLGSPDHDRPGASFYLQRPEPWVIVLGGAETYGAEGFFMMERFDPPLTLDLRGLGDGPISGETTVVISDGEGWSDEGPYRLTVTLVGFEDVAVAAGAFSDTAHLHLTAEEPGGFVAETDLWMDAEQALVRLAPAHIFDSLELAGPWSG